MWVSEGALEKRLLCVQRALLHKPIEKKSALRCYVGQDGDCCGQSYS